MNSLMSLKIQINTEKAKMELKLEEFRGTQFLIVMVAYNELFDVCYLQITR